MPHPLGGPALNANPSWRKPRSREHILFLRTGDALNVDSESSLPQEGATLPGELPVSRSVTKISPEHLVLESK